MAWSRRAASLFTALGLVALAAGFVLYADRQPPPVVSETAPPPAFSAQRAMRHVRVVAERPHPPGSVDHARVRGYITSELTALGLDPVTQESTGFSTCGGVSGRVRNIIAR